MNRRQRSDGQWEVLVNTPAGYTWQLESAPAPPVSNNPYASYNPMGRQQGVPASAYTKHTPYKNMFDAEFGSLLGDAFKYVPKNIGICGDSHMVFILINNIEQLSNQNSFISEQIQFILF